MTRQLGRRDALRAGGLAALASVAGCSSLSDVLGGGGGTGSWATYQGGPAHTGVNQAAAGPGDDLDQRWQRGVEELYEGDEELVVARLSPPAVVDGSVYTTLTGRSREGRAGVTVLALDAADGSVDWRTTIFEDYTQTAGLRLPTPTVADGTVVVSFVNAAAPTPAVGVDADSGDVAWESTSDRLAGSAATPMGDRLVFGGETAFALDGEGDLAWRFAEGNRPPYGATNKPPTVANGSVYVPTRGGGLFALDESGERRWRRELASENEYGIESTVSTPAVDGDVYVTTGNLDESSDGRLLALSPDDGSTQWEFQPDFDADRRERATEEFFDEHGRVPRFPAAGVYGTPTLADGTLFAPGYRPGSDDPLEPDPLLFAIDAGDGSKVWETTLPQQFGTVPPAVAGATVYLPLAEGLARVDTDDGSVTLARESTANYPSGLAIAGDALYAGRLSSITAHGP